MRKNGKVSTNSINTIILPILTQTSGKSTFLSVLLRLLDPTSGIILIDNIDITTLPRNFVRERIICLPQDPLLMSGTFEFNLNPQSGPINTTDLESALKQVGLFDLVIKRGGLQAEFQPESLSHGEQQLLALARAIVRKRLAAGRCILVLDEATSNLDAATEGVVRDVVRSEFGENTVISVAHRLDTLRDCDLVLVLADGEAVRSGRPEEVMGIADEELVGGDDEKVG
jgi:ATP-binding cassette subfamily C (CFTR/MRP) protein 1